MSLCLFHFQMSSRWKYNRISLKKCRNGGVFMSALFVSAVVSVEETLFHWDYCWDCLWFSLYDRPSYYVRKQLGWSACARSTRLGGKLLCVNFLPQLDIAYTELLLSFESYVRSNYYLLDPETGPQLTRALPMLFLLLCFFWGMLLLSDFQSTKALSFLNRSLSNFSHISLTTFCIELPCRIFDLGHNCLVIISY